MATKVLDVTKHSYDPASILEWMLENWMAEPQTDLLVITYDGDGSALDNRLRVKLSGIRRALKNRDTKFVQFGFESDIIKWSNLDGEYEAVCLHYRVHLRHQIADAFDELFK